MSEALPRSVVAAEDAKFCFHNGIDWDSVRTIIEDAQDGEVARGGSTITQQVAKNLFLWPGRSVIRKALEFPLAMWIDLILSKKRILELYLNVAELGPDGQFGAEAGAEVCFCPPGFGTVGARSCLVGIYPAQSGDPERPKSGAWGAADGRDLCGPGPIGRNLRLLGAKSLILGHFNSFSRRFRSSFRGSLPL
jgi:hypothetical protein